MCLPGPGRYDEVCVDCPTLVHTIPLNGALSSYIHMSKMGGGFGEVVWVWDAPRCFDSNSCAQVYHVIL